MVDDPQHVAADKIAELQDTILELQWLNRLAQKIISAPNLEQALDEIVIELSQFLHADGIALLLVNPGRVETEITHSKQLFTLAQELKGADDPRLQQLSRNVAGWMIKHKSSLFSTHLASDERFPGLALLGSLHYGVAGVPIWAGAQLLGTLVVFKSPRLEAEQVRLELLEQVARHLAPAFENLRRVQELAEENSYYRQAFIAQNGFAGIIARSEAMQDVFNVLQRVIPNDVRVLLEGESGTGKELIARTIHYNGPRREKKFLAVDCGAIPENLLESELFGYLKGAFTGAAQNRKGLFQEAHGGTLFLDEVNNLPVHLQAKLLRVLQEGEVRPLGSNVAEHVNVRIISASSRPLPELVKAKEFREDLYFRLKVIALRLPSLRDRIGDVPLLAQHFLEKFSKHYRRDLRAFETAAMHLLQRYSWPGNIREFEHMIEQAVVLAPHDAAVIAAKDLPIEIRLAESGAPQDFERMKNLPEAVETLERNMIRKALQETRGNKSQAAEQLGLSRRGLLNKLDRYNIEFQEKA